MSNSGAIARRLSEDAVAALESGDIQRLIAINHAEFGSSVMMADDEDGDGDGDGGDSGDSGAGGKADDADKDSGSAGDSGKSDDDADAEAERVRKRMRAADKRADEAERKLKELEDAKKDDLTKATDELTEAKETVEKLTGENSQLRLQIAFLTANKHTWHDGETALDIARSKGYLEDVTDEDTGVVDKKALGKALDKLANDHKYLLKSEKGGDDGPGQPSGQPAGGRSGQDDDNARKKQLKRRFSSVANR